MNLRYIKFIVTILILGSSLSVSSQNETVLDFYYSGWSSCSPFTDFPANIELGWKSSHGSPNFSTSNNKTLLLTGKNNLGEGGIPSKNQGKFHLLNF